MRSPKNLILPALAALTLITAVAADARPRLPIPGVLPNLAIDRTRTNGQTVVYVLNTGPGASTPCHVRIELENGAVYYFGIWSLQSGGNIGLQLPSYQRGKPYTFTITVDCQQEVGESNENDNVESMRF